MRKAMVIDDSKTVRSYHKALLSAEGLDIVEAENGMEAIERSLDGDIVLFLVDVNMPIMDGYSFVKEIRKNESYAFTPIIMITTQAHDVDKEEAYKMGANLFEVKPIKPDVLKSFIKILLP